MPASRTYFQKLHIQFSDEMLQLVDELRILHFDDQPINPKSDIDSRAFLAHLGLTTTKTTDGGLPSTAKDSIEHLRYINPAMETFFNWRELQHRRDGFCQPILDSMGPHNLHSGDIHNIMGELLITRTTSRRPSMKKKIGEGINLLNLPSRQSEGSIDGLNKRIRGGFITPDGELLHAADLSQIELRILAHYSQDSTLLDIYRNDGDIHAMTATQMFNLPIDQIDNARHRKFAKTVNFMTVYGGGGHRLYNIYRQENITQFDKPACDRFVAGFDERYPGVPEWKNQLIWNAKRNGAIVYTWGGMPRFLPNLWSDDNRLSSAAKREAVSHVIQGTAQDLIQNSMGWVYRRIVELREQGVDVWLALQLYDELIHRCEDGVVDIVDEIVLEGLTKHHGMEDCLVPILADSSKGECWGEL